MGTNFYVFAPEPPPGVPAPRLPGADDGERALHVGKSSAGWRFTFRAHPALDAPISTREHWERALDGLVRSGPCELVDEYGDVWDLDSFWKMVERKRDDYSTTEFGDHGQSYQDETGADFVAAVFS